MTTVFVLAAFLAVCLGGIIAGVKLSFLSVLALTLLVVIVTARIDKRLDSQGGQIALSLGMVLLLLSLWGAFVVKDILHTFFK